MLDCMKRQLTECRIWEHHNFGFGTIFCSFFFERVPSLSPRETIRGHKASLPVLCRWEVLLLRQGGGRTIEAFDDKFFDWWSRNIPEIEDYPYARINFSRDPDMPVPPGVE
jgi:diadenosine tetraphosphatase ApaH/serine/threonine PP2A family protein phosphatase